MNYAQYDARLARSYAYDEAIEKLVPYYIPDYDEIAEHIDIGILIKLIHKEDYGRAYEMIESVISSMSDRWAEAELDFRGEPPYDH